MNLDQVATSPGGAGSTCSLSSLLTLGCRSRAESLAHKLLKTKLWSSLGSSVGDDESRLSQDPRRHSWVTVEARVGVGSQVETVVTSIPIASHGHGRIGNHIPFIETLSYPQDLTTMENAKNVQLDAWMSGLTYQSLVRDSARDGDGDSARDSTNSVDQASDASSTSGQTGGFSDSDQYFDFGIETPELLASGDEDDSTIIINHDDGLPSQSDSRCIFSSPPSSPDSDAILHYREQLAFYDVYDQAILHDQLYANQVEKPVLVLGPESDSSSSQDQDQEEPSNNVEHAPNCPSPTDNCQDAIPRESASRRQEPVQGETEDAGTLLLSRPLLGPTGAHTGVLQDCPAGSHEATDPETSISISSADVCESTQSDANCDMVMCLQNRVDDHELPLTRPPSDCLNSIDAEIGTDRSPDAADEAISIEINVTEAVSNADCHVDHDLCPKDVDADQCADVAADLHAGCNGQLDDRAQNVQQDALKCHLEHEALDVNQRSNSSSDEEEISANETRLISRVGRSTSLKSGKTPPGTPGRKKIVRFADALGLDLALVRTFLDEVPNVPQSAFSDLSGVEDDTHSPDSCHNNLVTYSGPYQRRRDPPLPVASLANDRSLVAGFVQPYTTADFIDKLKNRKVCLESAVMVEDMTIRGQVRVLNIDFHKSVIIRYTSDEWLTHSDIPASYTPNSCDGLSDRFSFSLFAYQLQPGQRIFFAVCYRVAGQEFWDSNQGSNYVFQCVSTRNSLASAIPLDSPIMDRFLPYM